MWSLTIIRVKKMFMMNSNEFIFDEFLDNSSYYSIELTLSLYYLQLRCSLAFYKTETLIGEEKSKDIPRNCGIQQPHQI